MILITKKTHYLNDLLIKTNYSDLNIEIATIINNHDTLHSLIKHFNIPFKLINHKKLNHNEHNQKITNTIDTYQPNYIILTKYIQILTPKFITHFPNKIINIHHSFLPTFINTHPYHQTYKHNIKIINATTHYINNNLNKNPIIIQNIIHIDHTYTTKNIIHTNRNIEKNILNRTLYKILTQRIFIYNNRTIIL